jgi:DNA adenine methylase
MNNKSPLRYPGGKTRACTILDKLFNEHFVPSHFDTLVSPFFGGGSFEFHLQSHYGYEILGNDKFTPLYSFWTSCKEHKDELTRRLDSVKEVTKENFSAYRNQIMSLEDAFDQAFYYFIINRCSFSGATLSGGFSEEASKKRFTSSSISKIKNIDLSATDFLNLDAVDFIDNYVNSDKQFLFLDPPYYLEEKSKLYGYNGDLHEEFNHESLYNSVKDKKGWMMTYNNCDYIKELYKDFLILEVDWSYGMNKSKKSSEIVIISK